MTVSKSFHPQEEASLNEFACAYINMCKECGIPHAKKQAKAVLAYLENPFSPFLLAEVDVMLCWDVLSTMDREEFLEDLFRHFTFLLKRQVMLDSRASART